MTTPFENEKTDPKTDSGVDLDTILQRCMEAILLAFLCASPWAFGVDHPTFMFLIYVGVLSLVALWGSRILLARRFLWNNHPVVWLLACLIILDLCQLLPMSREFLKRISPGTARAYDQLLPPQPEQLSKDESPPARSRFTISLYVGVSRFEIGKHLAVFLLFLVVLNNLALPAPFRRLCVVLTINGAMLALFSVAQYFSTGSGKIFFPGDPVSFGPFSNRNTFSPYMNLCLNLAVGLWLARFAIATAVTRARHNDGNDGKNFGASFRLHNPRSALYDSQLLWLSLAILLMVSSIIVCQSRGGLCSLVGGLLVLLIIMRRRRSFLIALLGGGLALLFFLAWLGFDWNKSRYISTLSSMLHEGDVHEGRLLIWSHALVTVREFPIWGTGIGTFHYLNAELAHNEFLKSLVEEGIVGLLLRISITCLILRSGYRAAFRRSGQSNPLAIGGFLALLVLLLHSFVENLSLAVVGFLATVICAHLCAMDKRRLTVVGLDTTPKGTILWRYAILRGTALCAGTSTLLALAGVLVFEGWRTQKAVRGQLSAFRLTDHRDEMDRKIAALESAERIVPENVGVQIGLAEAYFAKYHDDQAVLAKRFAACQASQCAATISCSALGQVLSPSAVFINDSPSFSPCVTGLRYANRSTREGACRHYLVLALRHLLMARDLCPVLSVANLRIAANTQYLARCDPRQAYLSRAKMFAGRYDSNLLYQIGLLEISDRDFENAWVSFRTSLELEPRHLQKIISISRQYLSPEKIAEEVVPADPILLAWIARHMYSTPELSTGRRPFLRRALVLLEEKPGPLTTEEYHVKATAHAFLGDSAEAINSYRAALASSPRNVEVRYEFADYLYRDGNFKDARAELMFILRVSPGHAQATQLLQMVQASERLRRE